jgi:hypothetical protein
LMLRARVILVAISSLRASKFVSMRLMIRLEQSSHDCAAEGAGGCKVTLAALLPHATKSNRVVGKVWAVVFAIG